MEHQKSSSYRFEFDAESPGFNVCMDIYDYPSNCPYSSCRSCISVPSCDLWRCVFSQSFMQSLLQ